MASLLPNASGEKKHFFYVIIAQRQIQSVRSNAAFPLISFVLAFHWGIPCHLPALVYIKMDHLLRQTSKLDSALS
jgi:hypothetical protein